MTDDRLDPRVLLRFARARIREELGGPATEAPAGPGYDTPGATFVTLYRSDGELQGCIGSIEPRRPLAEDVGSNAVAAAFYDPRAEALTLDDVERLRIELSLLSRLQRLPCAGPATARRALRPFVDGVVLRHGRTRATFLPQVWQHLPDPDDFLAALAEKAGLPAGYWDEQMQLFRYTVQKFADPSDADVTDLLN